jgi:hypothetical protein
LLFLLGFPLEGNSGLPIKQEYAIPDFFKEYGVKAGIGTKYHPQILAYFSAAML